MAVSAVTRLKVLRAIAAGTRFDLDALVAATSRPRDEVQAVMWERDPPERVRERRTSATIAELMEYARPILARSGIGGIISHEYLPAACGCMGPRDGFPLCPCGMRAALAANRDAVALALLEE